MATTKKLLKEKNGVTLEEVVLAHHEDLISWVVKNQVNRSATRIFDAMKTAEKYFKELSSIKKEVTKIKKKSK